MSISCSNIYFANRALAHIGKTVQEGRKKICRGGSPYEFFSNHGLRVEIKTEDGYAIPEELMARLTLAVDIPPPPALGNGKYMKSGQIPVEICDKKERDKARRALRVKRAKEVMAFVRREDALGSADEVQVEEVVIKSM
jgi:hypothetical protein